MSLNDIIGSVGVFFMLLAFGANLVGKLDHKSRVYEGLNALGAGIACYASWRISYIPFVVLEGIWAVAALVALIITNRSLNKRF